MGRLVFASRHCLIPKNKNKKKPKGCPMVMADASDLRNGTPSVDNESIDGGYNNGTETSMIIAY